MRKSFFDLLIIAILFIIGCATPQILIHTKPGTDFSQYRKVAVITLASNDQSLGQEVSDLIALTLMTRGFDVAERSQLRAIIDENVLIHSGLTDKDRSALRLEGVDIIIVGSVTRYDCEQSGYMIPTVHGPIAGSTNRCHASMSFKMVNVQNGDVLWAGQGSHSLKGGSMTAGKVLQRILGEMEKQIPLKRP
jgi:curli biogenesis system outer membrane secretion channel CsgG